MLAQEVLESNSIVLIVRWGWCLVMLMIIAHMSSSMTTCARIVHPKGRWSGLDITFCALMVGVIGGMTDTVWCSQFGGSNVLSHGLPGVGFVVGVIASVLSVGIGLWSARKSRPSSA